ncbi:Pre-mRNA-splicing factor 18 [Taenia crassiceps]|uniref:Pre-mRNA-splicing factor 18 n=1 Tax=Taenia crassiceps TaxID=6207 RepID=A0ABR4QEN4_9CEST
MDLLIAEIARKRKSLQDNGLITKEKKYFKRSELAKLEEHEYTTKCKYRTNIVLSEDDASYSSLLQSTPEENLLLKKMEREREEKAKGKLMPRREVVKLLRERNQPIRLFGESDFDTFQRLKRIQLLEPESKGLRNDLLAAMDKVDEDEDEAVFGEVRNNAAAAATSDGSANLEVAIKKDYISPEEMDVLKVTLSSYVMMREPNATDDATAVAASFARATDMHHVTKTNDRAAREEVSEHVLRYLKFLLSKWGTHLNQRSREVKQSYSGKMASATYNQTLEYIKPLFKLLKTKRCQDDILDSLVKVVVLLMDRNYLKANDAYLDLAIGKAPWPLGVTNHGIHQRTAQDKIHAKNVAHVLNDETQRKFIQGIKRLMTRAQEFFPTDPSRCVNYMKPPSSASDTVP